MYTAEGLTFCYTAEEYRSAMAKWRGGDWPAPEAIGLSRDDLVQLRGQVYPHEEKCDGFNCPNPPTIFDINGTCDVYSYCAECKRREQEAARMLLAHMTPAGRG